MGKTTQSTQTSSSPPPQVLANYQALVDRATNVANAPYQPYTGSVVPDLNANQNTAFDVMGGLYGIEPAYISQALGYVNQGASPINLSPGYTNQYVSPYSQSGAANANAAGSGLAAYGTNAAQNLGSYAANIGASGPQLQQYNSQNLQQYINPYTQNVVDTTMANLNRNDAIQSNNLRSSAIMGGNAFGGDRAGVAQAELARNQDLANGQTIAGLQSAGFTNAQQAFNTNNQQALAGAQTALGGMNNAANLGLNAQQAGAQLGLAGAQLGTSGYQNAQQLALAQQQAQNQFAANAGNQTAALGNQALQSYLTGAQAQLAAGNQQQQQAAAQLAWPYQQYQQATAFPYQQTQFLGNAILGTGSASGGTSTTTSPGPNQLTQALGLGIAGAGLFIKDGGAVPGYASGGNIAAENIQPINFSASPLGLAGLTGNMGPMTMRGKGPPSAPAAAGSGANSTSGLQQQLGGLSGAFSGALGSGTMGSPGVTSALPVIGGAGDMAVPTFMSRGGFASSGGLVPYSPFGGAFADGGDVIDATDLPPLDERFLGLGQPWSPTNTAIDNDVGGGPKMPPPMPHGLAAAPLPPPMPQPRPSLPPEISAGQSDVASADQSQPDAMSYAPTQGLRAAPPPQASQDQPPSDTAAALQAALQQRTIQKPSLGQAMMAAGLGMMSSRNPTLLGGIGEGGQAGLKNYEAQQKEINDLDAHPVIDSSGKTKLIIYPSTGQVIDTGIPTEAAATQAQRDLTNASAPLIRDKTGAMIPNPAYLALKSQEKDLSDDKVKPGIIDYKDDGTPIQGFIDSTNKKYYLPGGQEYTPRSPVTSGAPSAESPSIEQVQKDGSLNVNKAQAAAPYNYSKNSPVVEKGYDVPPPAAVAGKSPQTIEAEAEYYLQTGKFLTPVTRSSTVNSIQQQNYRTAIQNYANTLAASRGMSPQEVADGWRTAPGMIKFILGPDGRSTVALGTAERHLDTLRQYITAYNGNDQPTLRRIGAIIDKQFGRTGATTIDAMSSVVGPEIVKALGVAGAGTESERNNFEHMFQLGGSQAKDAIAGITKLLGGQLEGKERHAKEVGVAQDRFKRLIGDDEYNKIKGTSAGASAAPAATADPISKAKDAIARGAPRDAVIQRLKAAGIDTSGL